MSERRKTHLSMTQNVEVYTRKTIAVLFLLVVAKLSVNFYQWKPALTLKFSPDGPLGSSSCEGWALSLPCLSPRVVGSGAGLSQLNG